ncbi:helix-turn-helix transcriptional regulator [Conexibacter sp. CPCC 205706]
MRRQKPDSETFQEARDRLAARMRALRSAASMPQSAAASRAGIDRTTWGRIEAGRLDVRLDTLLRIQFALEVDTLEGLFGETTGDLFVRQGGAAKGAEAVSGLGGSGSSGAS